MNNNQPLAQPHPSQQNKSNKTQLIWGLVCLIGPSALLILTILTYAVINMISGSSTTDEASLFAEPSVGETALDVIMYLVGAATVLTLLPGIIVGIVLLATRKS